MCKILTLGGYWPTSSKVEITNFGGCTNNCCDVFLASIFLLYVEPKLFFRTRGKILQYSPYLGHLGWLSCPPIHWKPSKLKTLPLHSLYFYFFVALFDPRKQRVNVLPHTKYKLVLQTLLFMYNV